MQLVNAIPCRTNKVKNIVKALFNYYTTFLITDYKNTKTKVGNSNKKLHSFLCKYTYKLDTWKFQPKSVMYWVMKSTNIDKKTTLTGFMKGIRYLWKTTDRIIYWFNFRQSIHFADECGALWYIGTIKIILYMFIKSFQFATFLFYVKDLSNFEVGYVFFIVLFTWRLKRILEFSWLWDKNKKFMA